MEEKRKYIRVPADTIVMYQTDVYPITENIDAHKVDTPLSVDLSMGGLQIETNQKLKKGVILQIVLAVSEPKIPMQIKGRVIWVKNTEEKNIYLIGIEFTDFGNCENKDIIEAYVDSLNR